jgi:hypothetical protein
MLQEKNHLGCITMLGTKHANGIPCCPIHEAYAKTENLGDSYNRIPLGYCKL